MKVGDTVSEVAFLFHVGSRSTVYAASHVQLLTLRWEDFVNIQAVQKDDVQTMRANSLAYFRQRVKATLSTTEDPDTETGAVPLVESNGARQVRKKDHM